MSALLLLLLFDRFAQAVVLVYIRICFLLWYDATMLLFVEQQLVELALGRYAKKTKFVRRIK